jgi:hypothetical protein
MITTTARFQNTFLKPSLDKNDDKNDKKMAPPGARTITHRTLASRVSAADSRRRRRRRRRRHPCRAPLTDTERGLALGDGLEGVLDLEQLALGRERRERKVEGHFFETVVCCTIAENFLFCVWIQYIFACARLCDVFEIAIF